MSCATCPDIILNTLAADVDDTMQRIRVIREAVRIINRFFQQVSDLILTELEYLVSLIPDPPLLDLRQLFDMLACPLTPQAILVDQLDDLIYYVEQQLSTAPLLARPAMYGPTISTYSLREGTALAASDPRTILKRMASLSSHTLAQIEQLIEDAIGGMGRVTGWGGTSGNLYVDKNLSDQGFQQTATVFTTHDQTNTTPFIQTGNTGQQDATLLRYPVFDNSRPRKFVFSAEASEVFKIARRLTQRLISALESSDTFAVKLAVTTASVNLVQATCPEIYNRRDLPFIRFNDEIRDFTFDGVLPSGFDDQAQRLAGIMMTLQRKIASWQQAQFVLLR